SLPPTPHPALSPVSFLRLPATPTLSTLSLHDALPISGRGARPAHRDACDDVVARVHADRHDSGFRGQRAQQQRTRRQPQAREALDRKSTRLNSSHQIISYAVFCLKKKTSTIKYHNNNT